MIKLTCHFIRRLWILKGQNLDYHLYKLGERIFGEHWFPDHPRSHCLSHLGVTLVSFCTFQFLPLYKEGDYMNFKPINAWSILVLLSKVRPALVSGFCSLLDPWSNFFPKSGISLLPVSPDVAFICRGYCILCISPPGLCSQDLLHQVYFSSFSHHVCYY